MSVELLLTANVVACANLKREAVGGVAQLVERRTFKPIRHAKTPVFTGFCCFQVKPFGAIWSAKRVSPGFTSRPTFADILSLERGGSMLDYAARIRKLHSFVIDTGQSGGLEQAMEPIRGLLRGVLAAIALGLAFSMVVASSQPELKRPTNSTERRVRELIGQLDHGTFAQREQATKDLKKLGRSIVPQLEAALDQAPSLEVQRRLQQVLDWYRVRPEWHTDRAEFVKRLRNGVREVNFDDLDTSTAETVSFAADRYAKKHGIIITGDGGQYASRTFGFPDQYPSVSAPNLFAPGPMAHRNAGGGTGGFRTDVTFNVGGQPAGVAGFAAVFIDADHPDIGPSSLRVFDRLGKALGEPRIVKGGNASQVFCGVLAVDGAGNLMPAIGRVHIVNGRNWPGVNEGEGTALDDFLFAEPMREPDGRASEK